MSAGADDHELLARALAALDDESLRRAVRAMREESRLEVATQLQLPRAAMHLGDALAPLLRRKLRAAPAERRLTVAFALCEQVNEDTIAALGTRHDEPTRADMEEVLPGVLERHGAPLVALMLASYAATDARCRPVFADLLRSDARVAVGDPVADAPDGGAPDGGAPESGDGRPDTGPDAAALEEKRRRRRDTKANRRSAGERERAARAAAEAKRKEARRLAKRSPGT